MNGCDTDLTESLDEIAAVILHRSGVKRPPINAVEIARRLGYHILWDNRQSGRARVAAVRSAPGRPPRAAIFLRRDPRPERIQWAVAHEIGEQFAGEVYRRLRVDPAEAPVAAREEMASAIATRLLLPGKWFTRDAADAECDVLALKAEYSTASHELIARRLLDLPTLALVTIFDHGKLKFRRWNRPGRPPGLSPMELQLWHGAHETGEVARAGGPPRIDVWPVHEPGWKREILRLELPDDECCW